MKILILGGTGAMGMSLVPVLAAKDCEVYVTSRRKHENRAASGGAGSVYYLQGDAHDDNFLREILSTHYDAIVDFMVYTVKEFSRRVKLLLESCEQYVFLSSSRVYAASNKPLTENSPRLLDVCEDEGYLATSEYALIKAREEDILRNSGKSNWTIIRPYITYNSNRLQLGVYEKEDWLYRALKGRTVVFMEDMADHMTTLTYGGDVADVMGNIIGK